MLVGHGHGHGQFIKTLEITEKPRPAEALFLLLVERKETIFVSWAK
jgi:hypothetical protein